MLSVRRMLVVLVALGALLALPAPSMAIVGGNPAEPGEYPSVARVSYGAFLCTGTLIAPDTVLTAGHCSSLTAGATAGLVSSPVAWPAQLIDVRIGGNGTSDGERVPVKSVTIHPNYFLNAGYDISILHLSRNSTKPPVKVAGAGERGTWSVGTLETIAGFGATEEGGDASDTLQEAQVPIVGDPDCANAYGDFDARSMVCAGYPQGGTDTCQGDSGGPMFGKASTGERRLVGATSFGEGCARPGRPGVYARVADDELREWIRSKAPAGVN